MSFKEIIERASEKRREKKELFKKMLEQDQLEAMVLERRKSSNERELERYIKEEREKQIKEQLGIARKKRQNEINFEHNPLDIKNITVGTKWNVLKEKNQFIGRGNMFQKQKFIHKSNKNLLNNNNYKKRIFNRRCDLI